MTATKRRGPNPRVRVPFWTAPGRRAGVALTMTLKHMVVSVYVLAVAAGAVASGVTSGAGLIVFTAVAVLPSGALLVLCRKAPSQTLSRTSQAARR